MSAYVFLGPSLPIAEAPLIFDATYLPPVQQGDILRLLRRKPRFIGIVDGFFETVPAVWHKEILFALKSGVHVFGAASMGALRAAELHAFGMVGIGEVFAWYRDGVISSDDEVAVSHGPKELDYVAVNDTLVDIRDSCLSAVRAGVLTPDVADELIALGKAMPYRARSFDAIAKAYCGPDPAVVVDWLEHNKRRGRSLKARDAIALLDAMREFAATDPAPKAVSFEFERSVFFERLRNEVALEAVNGGKHRDLVADASTTGSGASALRNGMLLRILARQTGEMLGWQLDVDEVSDYARRFCARYDLSDAGRRQAWLDKNAISEKALWHFIYDAVLIQRLGRLHGVQIDEEIAEHIVMPGQDTQLGGTDDADLSTAK
jgi:hypothetical protein